MFNKMIKAQSAMEYLMTYGWAILIIAVVLGALFSLGVFSGSSLLGTSCVASPGYLCQTPSLLSSGTLSFTLGQNTGASVYNIELACGATAGSSGLPLNISSWAVVQTITGNVYNANTPMGGVWNANTVANALALVSGQTAAVSNLICYSNAGLPIGSQRQTTIIAADAAPIGTAFTGYLWLNYTTSAAQPSSSSNPWYTVKVATLTIKVV
jgi:hypothetical protein